MTSSTFPSSFMSKMVRFITGNISDDSNDYESDIDVISILDSGSSNDREEIILIDDTADVPVHTQNHSEVIELIEDEEEKHTEEKQGEEIILIDSDDEDEDNKQRLFEASIEEEEFVPPLNDHKDCLLCYDNLPLSSLYHPLTCGYRSSHFFCYPCLARSIRFQVKGTEDTAANILPTCPLAKGNKQTKGCHAELRENEVNDIVTLVCLSADIVEEDRPFPKEELGELIDRVDEIYLVRHCLSEVSLSSLSYSPILETCV
jgi:hypothetical protein